MRSTFHNHAFRNRYFIKFRQQAIPMHAMVSACGVERIATATYDWHGIKRGQMPFALFQYTVAGKGMLSYEGRSFEVLPGHAMILHFPHNHRYWWPKGNPPWELIWVTLYGSEAMRIWMAIESRLGPLVAIKSQAPVFAAFKRIIDDPVPNSRQTTFHISALAYQFMMSLAEETIPRLVASPTEANLLQKVVLYCRQHFNEPIGVAELAQIAGFSRYHFSRLFKRSHGMAPAEFLAHLRLQEAVRLLHEEDWPIKEIAARCGYRDVNYFCRTFRRALGTSPGDLRKSGIYRS